MNRDSQTAQTLNEEGLRAVDEGNLTRAEEKFRAALTHDLYSPAAHNNLGLVLLETGKYYEAAWEFDYAAQLLPRATAPRQNLALLYENLGRLDRAIEGYEGVLEIDPDNLTAMRHLARAYVKADRKDDKPKRLLEKLLGIPADRQWDAWIRGQLVRLDRAELDEPSNARP